MLHYVVNRLLQIVPTLIGISILIFSFMHLLPGNPALAIMGVEATSRQIAQIEREYGLDKPLFTQYIIWIGKVLQGDLGTSIVLLDTTSHVLQRALPITFQLTSIALLISIAISIPAGILSAIKRNTWLDNLIRMTSFVGKSIPNFWFALILMLLFAVYARILPAYGYVNILRDPIEGVRHTILPALTLGTGLAALLTRMTRSCVLEELSEDYVRTARSKGLTEKRVLARHVLRNAMTTIITVIGLQFAGLLGGAVLTESIFGLPGLGKLVVDSVGYRDYQVVQGVVLVYALMVALINLAVDITYAYVDPRIRYS